MMHQRDYVPQMTSLDPWPLLKQKLVKVSIESIFCSTGWCQIRNFDRIFGFVWFQEYLMPIVTAREAEDFEEECRLEDERRRNLQLQEELQRKLDLEQKEPEKNCKKFIS